MRRKDGVGVPVPSNLIRISSSPKVLAHALF
jgi:hypothetical protein